MTQTIDDVLRQQLSVEYRPEHAQALQELIEAWRQYQHQPVAIDDDDVRLIGLDN